MRIKTIYILFTLAGLASLAACSDKRDDTPRVISDTAVIEVAGNIPESRTAMYDEPVTVGIDAAADGGATVDTRAVLSDDMRTVHWTDNDKVVLWASNPSGSNGIGGEQFEYCTQTAANTARFTGNIKVTDDEYRCVAVYPVPARTEGRRVTYTLPDKQDGTYRSELDIMSSDPSSGKLVESTGSEGVHLTMHHMCHALQIRIPEGRNRWGKPVTRLLVEFPREVAGDISFEVSEESGAGSVTLTNGKRTIELDLSKAPFDESTDGSPRYLWVFITAGAINGDISFTPLFEDGYCAETLSATVDREFQGGRVTPIDLTISAKEQPVTWIDFTVDYTQLGEAVNTLTVTAPENARFRGDKQSTSVSIGNDGKFSVGYYAKFYPDAFKGAKVDLVYDSTHAIVTGTATLPASPVTDGHNSVAVKAPYLLEEHFDSALDFTNNLDKSTNNPNGISLAEANLSGWTAARVKVHAKNYVQIAVRHETVAEYPGRLDTPQLPIKPAFTNGIKISVTFDAYRTNSYVYVTCGKISGTNPLKGDNGVNNGIKIEPKDNDFESYNIQLSEFTSQNRISWVVQRTYDWGNAGILRTWYTYFDNIRVSIAQ